MRRNCASFQAASLRTVCYPSTIARGRPRNDCGSLIVGLGNPCQRSVSNPSHWLVPASGHVEATPSTRGSTCARGTGKGPSVKRRERDLSVLPRALVRPGRGAQVRAGPGTKTPRPQEHRRRWCGTERVSQPRSSTRPFPPPANTKKGQEPSPAPALLDAQNSSSIAPCTVCTTRLARCAGKAL